jgi:hypothetical protein
MKNWIQLPLSEMPRGIARPVALLDATAQSLGDALGITFERTRDDLDHLDAALFQLNTGQFFALAFHLNAPVKGVEVIISEKTLTPRVDLDLALASLGSALPRLIWRHPDL